MRYTVWTLGVILIILAASCNNPMSSEVTIEVANQMTSNSCGVFVNLDGAHAATITSGNQGTFPVVSAGSHTLNFSTSGACQGNCEYTNNNSIRYSVTFNTVAGNVYSATVTQSGTCSGLFEQGP